MICLTTDPMVVDTFAGGGGAGLGMSRAFGRSADIAINHDPRAIAMYARNHPETMVVLEDVYLARLAELVGERRIAALWASPDCKHFSRAKGGKPVDKGIRSLAWVIVKWAQEKRPERIFLENVREFRDWGPLLPGITCRACRWKGTEKHARLARTRLHCPKCDSTRLGELWVENKKTGRLVRAEIPDPTRKGQTFRRWQRSLESLGYVLEFDTLNAADFGVPTLRRRLFGIGRCDGQPIQWPTPTHCDPKKLINMVGGARLQPWRTAAECIDWSIPCPSIFGRKRELATATCQRVAKGIVREVLENPRPFIVGVGGRMGQSEAAPVDRPSNTITSKNDRAICTPTLVPITHSGERRVPSVAEPLPTITTAHRGELMLCTPTLVRNFHGERQSAAVDSPLATITTQTNKHLLIAPSIVQLAHGSGPDGSWGEYRSSDIREPIGTIHAGGNNHALVSAFMSQFNGKSIGQPFAGPAGCITSKNHQAIVTAHLAKHYGGVVGHGLNRPIGTVTGVDHHSLVTANLLHLNNNTNPTSPRDPLWTIAAGGTHAALCYSFLIKYYGTGISAHLLDPLDTVTASDRFGLVLVWIDGALWVMTDIGLRMLTPRELARCQGFGDDYVLSGNKTNDVARIGNSVPPALAEAIARANCPDLILAA